MSTVWFMVDDTDPRLNYTGSWTPLTLNATQVERSNNPVGGLPSGPVYNNTLHEARGNVSVSFRFNGSGFLGLYGSLDASGLFDAVDVEGTLAPSVDCSLDGFGIGTPETGNLAATPSQNQGPSNNALFCVVQGSITSISEDAGGFQPGIGEHVLEIAVTNFPSTLGWFFDYLTFESVPDPVVLDGEILQAGMAQVIDNVTDYSMLTFPESQGWVFDTNDLETFSRTQSNVTIDFNGTSLSMYGGLFGLNDNPFANGVYQVDKEDPVGFQVPILSSDAYNQLIFTADDLNIGAHSVIVSFNISPQSQMQLDYFYINSSAVVSEQPNSTSSTSPSSSPSPPSTSLPLSSHAKHPAVLIGAVLGSVIPAALLIVAILLWWRRYKRKRARDALPAQPVTDPFFNPTHSAVQEVQEGSLSVLPLSSSKRISDNVPSASSSSTTLPEAALTMKLQQRLVIMQDQLQAHQRDGQSDPRILPTVHTDSGLRLRGEGALDLDVPTEEIPPSYTEQ